MHRPKLLYVLSGLGLVLATNRLQFFRAFFVTNFTIAAVLFMIGCDKFLQLRDAVRTSPPYPHTCMLSMPLL